MKNKKRILVPIMVLALVVATIGGTLAWLKATSGPVTNTFTVGNVNVALEEKTGNNYHMIPGKEIAKDPKVTLTGTEDAWLFVKVDAHNTGDYLDYTIANGWTKLEGVDGVYYMDNPEKNVAFSVLTGDKVTVKDTVDNDLMDAAKKDAPTLTFKAYAVQKEGFAAAADAWAEVSK